MKTCRNCGTELATREGENLCAHCDACETPKELRSRRRNSSRKMREELLRSCGMVKVRGALGGEYWE